MPQSRADVAIIGAGITGMSIAWHLASDRAGSIVILERAAVGAGATSLQPGGMRQQWGSSMNCKLAREGYDFYSDLDGRLGFAVDAGFDECGYMFVAHSEDALAELAANVQVQHDAGVPSQLLDAYQAAALVPALNPATLVGAAYCANDGYFGKPLAVVAGLADSCKQLGVELQIATVDRVVRSGSSWRLEFREPANEPVEAEQVVLAAGFDSRDLLRPLGVDLPLENEPRYLFYSKPIRERLLEPLIVSQERHFAAKQLADGSVLASDLSAGQSPSEDETTWRGRIRRAISDLLPLLEFVSFPVVVTGFYDTTPDLQPLIGEIPGCPGLWVAAGLNGRGFMMAPAVGRLVTDAIVGDGRFDFAESLAADRFERGRVIRETQVV